MCFRSQPVSHLVVLLCSLAVLVACDNDSGEDCSDEVDNDGDSYVDCDDQDCFGSDDCVLDPADDDDDSALSTIDGDGDGLSPAEGDCDDEDPEVHPGADDSVGDGVDNNCDGVDGTDGDGDGHANLESGGDDCDDTDAAISPSADEVPGDGIDNDCNGNTDGQLPSEGGLALIEGADNIYLNSATDVSTAGDVDGDGRDDVWVGAPQASVGYSGYVGLFVASALDGPGPLIFSDTETVHHRVRGDQYDMLGTHVQHVGDLDGDGYSETLLGSSWVNSNGSAGNWLLRGDRLAARIASPDLNESHYSSAEDLAQSFVAPWGGPGSSLRHYIIQGPAEEGVPEDSSNEILFFATGYRDVYTMPWSAVPGVGNLSLDGEPTFSLWFDTTFQGGNHFNQLALGDLDGDGLTDLVLGGVDTTVKDDPIEASAFVCLRGSRGEDVLDSSDDADYRIHTPTGGDGLGWSIAVGDVDGDGRDDIVLASLDESTDSNGGVYLFLATTLETVAAASPDGRTVNRDDADVAFTVSPTEVNRQTAHQVLFHPDLDGDGMPDLIVRGRTSAEDPNFVLRIFYSGGLLATANRDILAPDAIWTAPEADSEVQSYMEAHVVGDMNADGLQDLAVLYDSRVRILTSLAP